MGVLDTINKIADVATGGLADTVLDAVKTYLPPSMSATEKSNLKLALEKLAMERERNTAAAITEAERVINERIAQYEGTASDLRAIPIIGPILIFVRGCQRPVWGLSTLYMDLQVFSGAWAVDEQRLMSALWIINLLVLGFLFGERAVKNLAPLITQMISAKGVAK
ncbi:hypothetical protein [Endothiovibrio diazotrophicus]